MNVKSILIGIVIGFLIGSIVGYGSFSAQISGLQGQIASLKSEAEKVPTLQQQIAQLQAQLENIQSPDLALIAVSFSRTEDTSSLLQYWIGRANSSIRVAIYSFTSDSLGDSIIAAKNRGVDVQVFIDNTFVSSTGSEYPKLSAAGVSIKADTRSAIMHHKFILIDGYIVGIGSYNWSANAEDNNDENLILLKSQSVAQAYLGEFNRLWS